MLKNNAIRVILKKIFDADLLLTNKVVIQSPYPKYVEVSFASHTDNTVFVAAINSVYYTRIEIEQLAESIKKYVNSGCHNDLCFFWQDYGDEESEEDLLTYYSRLDEDFTFLMKNRFNLDDKRALKRLAESCITVMRYDKAMKEGAIHI